MRFAVALLCALLAGCAAPPVRTLGPPTAVEPVAALLEAYNRRPAAVRVQGGLRVRGQGSVAFGAQAAEGVGLRLDAVAGPFSRPVLALACRAGEGCLAYLPDRGRAFRTRGEWGRWASTLLRGGVPVLGRPVAAWGGPGGERTVRFQGEGWSEDVLLDGEGRPLRVAFLRDGELRAEVRYGEYALRGGYPYPGRIEVEAADSGGYTLEFREVQTDRGINEDALSVPLPPGTELETLRGTPTWNDLPLSLPIPGG